MDSSGKSDPYPVSEGAGSRHSCRFIHPVIPLLDNTPQSFFFGSGSSADYNFLNYSTVS